jgi:regulator of protease activity HflC (stomatin/prohibitin superfamily)
MPPKDIQDAMEKQMRAERERREKILQAEGEKKSAVLIAEGKKESLILEAEAEKQAAILRAEAIKESKIREAEGEADAILKVQNAIAEGLKLINEANPSAEYLTLEGYKAVKDLADGQATKIVVPSEIQNISGLLASRKAVVAENNLAKEEEEFKF